MYRIYSEFRLRKLDSVEAASKVARLDWLKKLSYIAGAFLENLD